MWTRWRAQQFGLVQKKLKKLSLLWDSNSAVGQEKCSNSDHLATELGIHDTTHVE